VKAQLHSGKKKYYNIGQGRYEVGKGYTLGARRGKEICLFK